MKVDECGGPDMISSLGVPCRLEGPDFWRPHCFADGLDGLGGGYGWSGRSWITAHKEASLEFALILIDSILNK